MRSKNLLPFSLLTPLTLSMTAVLASTLASTRAEIRLPMVFGSHMVCQREKPIIVWGWAQPGETIKVEIASETQQARANDRGEWKATLPAMDAGGPYTLVVSGSSTVRFEDVMVGEVWLASGQSNMEMGIGACRDGREEIAAADHPGIRLLMVPNRWTPEPQSDIEKTTWKVCSPASIADGGWGGFSGAAYYFGRELHKQLGVPIGLIDATWGGTRIESWTPPEGFGAVPALEAEYDKVRLADPRTALHKERLAQLLDKAEQWMGAAREALKKEQGVPAMPVYPPELQPIHDLQQATALYNGMVHPLRPLGIRGAIWYQGESNSGEGPLYTERMKALIGGWRAIWGEGDFPFYYVQIAPFDYGGDPERIGEFWEAQAAAQSIPNSGMVVINDIGNLKDIHPANKQEVGRRLALWAIAKTYGRADVVCSGPTFKSMEREGNKLRVTFDHAGTGLKSRDGKPLSWFEIVDADEGGFVPANAAIDGSSVVLSSPEVKRPVALRFAWSMLAEPNLANSADLPAGAFRAGEVPKRDLLVLKVPEAKQYQLVYDLDLGRLGPAIKYDVDNHGAINRSFDRVAYFLELQTGDGHTQFVYAAMDAFTDSIEKICVPTVKSGAVFQQKIANLDVVSNVKGVTAGRNLPGGNIEFWPNNYGPANASKIPNASDAVYDFGDQPADPVDGYGSMQVHNFEARQTVFALNHWREGNSADIGIGNQAKNHPDWTFAGNAGAYKTKRLRILVRVK